MFVYSRKKKIRKPFSCVSDPFGRGNRSALKPGTPGQALPWGDQLAAGTHGRAVRAVPALAGLQWPAGRAGQPQWWQPDSAKRPAARWARSGMSEVRPGGQWGRAVGDQDVPSLNKRWTRTRAKCLSFSSTPEQKQGRPWLPSLNPDYSQALSAQSWSTGS